MDDIQISFVPKSKRKKGPPPKTEPSSHQKHVKHKRATKTDFTEDEKTLIQKSYTLEKPKTFRNITFACATGWNKHEDTVTEFIKTKERLYRPEKRKWEEDEFERPSSRPKELRKDFSEVRESRQWRANHQVSLRSRIKVTIPPLLQWISNDPNHPSILPHEVGQLLLDFYEKPLPVQAQCIPLALSGKDITGVSQTGTGKTLAYAVPMIAEIYKILAGAPSPFNFEFDETAGPLGVILVPTHELADQVERMIRPFCEPLGIRTQAIMGGQSIGDQAITLSYTTHIIVSTPGRLNDLLDRHFIVIGQCCFIALDEADKMIDRSFGPQIISIIQQSLPDRRLVMFSATMPEAVKTIVDEYFKPDHVTVRVGDATDPSEKIRQVIEYIDERKKKRWLDEKLHGMKMPIIIFVNSKDSCENLANYLGYRGFRIASIHSGKSQKDREQVINAITDKLIDVVVATDILARGIDIEKVENVINFEMPSDITTYIHRIGRTGRGDELGVATSFVTKEDTDIMYDLVKMAKRNNIHLPEALLHHPATQQRPSYDEIVEADSS